MTKGHILCAPFCVSGMRISQPPLAAREMSVDLFDARLGKPP